MSSDQLAVEQGSAGTEAEERRVVRKVDWVLMPILIVTLGLQYYDKAVLGSASVFGIIADLHLSQKKNGVTVTTRYSTVTAAFYYGYIVSVLPISLVLSRVPLVKTTSVLVVLWGLTALLTVVCTTYHGLLVQRIFLGIAESAVGPAFVAITTVWYKPYERAMRLGIWYSSTGIFSMISGVINFGIGHNSLEHPWKAMYYFAGAVTMVWGILIYFILPTSPLKPGFFFNDADKVVLARRFYENKYVMDRQPFRLNQLIEAVTDIKTWIYLFMGAAIYVCNASITAFGARIINSWGYSSLTTIALGIPGGAVTCVTIYLFSFLADKFEDSRTLVLPASCVPVIVGAIVAWTAPMHPRVGPLIGYYLVASFGAPYVLLLTIASSNTSGTTKKATVTGAIFIGYNVGNIAASYSVLTQEKPIRYRSAWITVLAGMAFTILASLVLRVLFARENRKRDRSAVSFSHGAGAGAAEDGREKRNELVDNFDLTDKERLDFRYTL